MKRFTLLAVIFAVILALGMTLAIQAEDSNQGVYIPQLPEYWWSWLKDFVTVQDDSVLSQATHAENYYLGFAPADPGRIHFPIWNKNGSSLALGDVCVWDSAKIAVTADTAKQKPARLVNDLSAEGGPCFLIACVSSGTASNDSLWIYGEDSSGTAATEIVVITNSAQYTRSNYLWAEIDSIEDNQSSGGWSTFIVYAEPYLGVIASGGALQSFAGIATATVADNDSGHVANGGAGIAWATVDGGSTAIYPGDLLFPTSAGDLAPLTTTTATFTQDSLSAVNVDKVFPVDSLVVKGKVTLTTIQNPIAVALEPCFSNNRLMRVMSIR